MVVLGTAFVAATYGLVRLAYGLFLPDIQRDLGLDAATAGYLASGSSLIYCVAATCGFVLADRAPPALIGAAAVSACGGVWGMAASDTVGIFGACAVLSAAGAGFASPALVSIIERTVDTADRDKAQSVVNAGTGPGLIGAGLVALALLPDWRGAWWLIGGFTATVAVLLVVSATGPATGSTRRRPARPSRRWLRRHLPAAGGAAALGAGSAAVWVYGRTYLVDIADMSWHATVAAWILLGIGAAAVIATAPAMARLPATRAWTVGAGLMTGSIPILLLTPNPNAAIAIGTLVVGRIAFGWGFTAATSALIAWTVHIDPARAAAGTSLLFVALLLGQAIGSTVVGLLITSAGYSVAFLTAAALGALSVPFGSAGFGGAGARHPTATGAPIRGSSAAPPASPRRARTLPSEPPSAPTPMTSRRAWRSR